MAGRGDLTASRLQVLFTQLDRNVEWWGFSGPHPRLRRAHPVQRQPVLYQYFPGQGLEFHPLANWGRLAAR
jgi:hypothetical protein